MREFAGVAPVPQHHGPVGDPLDLAEPVRDIDHADPRARSSLIVARSRSVSDKVSELVGSSIMITRAFCERALAISTICC